ncbi:1-acyl-sn-glycerol-3-phosphate acyltransferase [Flammeovirgaceae bacterium SG7u.111]|nr:1-acyl-sn-glycerol-3-phosphate acyltransferase [Flammeovirgaceae bacterium SG7u.132]WPO36862.1 1-acyl-sn-glycerol-3-phosphate acyltransferase [Flammeovirgaceae bacterium SG7u.111]
MLKFLSKIGFWIFGWKLGKYDFESVNRCVMIAAPHTSNWDLYFARCAFFLMGIPLRFTIKKEWFKFPANLLIGPLGGIAIDRSPKPGLTRKRSMVDAMADLFEENEELSVMVTPEGTRSKVTRWRSGFYNVAVKAGVPIGLGYLDYKNKVAGVGKMVYPTGDFKADMKIINDFYKDIEGKHPEKFSLHQIKE